MTTDSRHHLNFNRHFQDVHVTLPVTAGQTLVWNDLTSRWENGTAVVPAPVLALDDLDDVDVAGALTGDVLTLNNVGLWVDSAPVAAANGTVRVVDLNAPARAAALTAAGVSNTVAAGSDTFSAGLGAGFANGVAVGAGAGFTGDQAGRTLVGAGAGNQNAGAGSTAVGLNAGTIGMGAGCVAIGRDAGLGGMAAGTICIGDGAVVGGVQGLGLAVPGSAVNNDLPAGLDLSAQRVSLQTGVNGAPRVIPLYSDPAHVSVFLFAPTIGGGAAVAADGVPKTLTWTNPPLIETAGGLWAAGTPTQLLVPQGHWHIMVHVRLDEDAAALPTSIRIVRVMSGVSEVGRATIRNGGAGTGVIDIPIDVERLITGAPEAWTVDITIPVGEAAATLNASSYFFVRYLEAAV